MLLFCFKQTKKNLHKETLLQLNQTVMNTSLEVFAYSQKH